MGEHMNDSIEVRTLFIGDDFNILKSRSFGQKPCYIAPQKMNDVVLTKLELPYIAYEVNYWESVVISTY